MLYPAKFVSGVPSVFCVGGVQLNVTTPVEGVGGGEGGGGGGLFDPDDPLDVPVDVGGGGLFEGCGGGLLVGEVDGQPIG